MPPRRPKRRLGHLHSRSPRCWDGRERPAPDLERGTRWDSGLGDKAGPGVEVQGAACHSRGLKERICRMGAMHGPLGLHPHKPFRLSL